MDARKAVMIPVKTAGKNWSRQGMAQSESAVVEEWREFGDYMLQKCMKYNIEVKKGGHLIMAIKHHISL